MYLRLISGTKDEKENTTHVFHPCSISCIDRYAATVIAFISTRASFQDVITHG